jgi:hypothetical protein
MTPNDDGRLDRILRRDAREVIDDGGFTARVMGALPSRSPLPARFASRRSWLTPALVLGSTALGSVLAWLFAPGGVNAAQGFADLTTSGLTPAAITTLAMAIAVLIAAIVIAVDTD